jgi:RNA polymerase sigma-70 factor (ECF subfamily)
VARAAAGDLQAFERLYRTHLARIHSLTRRMAGADQADELTQDVFIRVWQKLGSSAATPRSRRGSIGSPSTW